MDIKYTVKVQKFKTYEINECGTWNPYYVLYIDIHQFANYMNGDKHTGSLGLKCLDINNNCIVHRFLDSCHDKAEARNLRVIETDPEIPKSFWVQLYKLENL